jgi:hypothetical protein
MQSSWRELMPGGAAWQPSLPASLASLHTCWQVTRQIPGDWPLDVRQLVNCPIRMDPVRGQARLPTLVNYPLAGIAAPMQEGPGAVATGCDAAAGARPLRALPPHERPPPGEPAQKA